MRARNVEALGAWILRVLVCTAVVVLLAGLGNPEAEFDSGATPHSAVSPTEMP